MTTIVYDVKTNTLHGDRQCIVDMSSWLYYNTDGQKVFMSPDRKIAFGSTGQNYGDEEVATFFKDIRTVLDLFYKTKDGESLEVDGVWGSLMNRSILIFTKEYLFTRRQGLGMSILDKTQNHTVGSGRLTALALQRANEKLNLGLSIDDIYKAISRSERLTNSTVDSIDLNELVPYIDIVTPTESEVTHHPV